MQDLHLSKQPRHSQLENGEQGELFSRVGQNLERVLFLLSKSLEFLALCPCYSSLPNLKLFCLFLASLHPHHLYLHFGMLLAFVLFQLMDRCFICSHRFEKATFIGNTAGGKA